MAKYDSLNESLKLALEVAQPFKDALAVLEQTSQYAGIIQSPYTDRIGLVSSALTDGLFDPMLSSRLQELFKPFEECQLLMDSFGTDLVKPNVYENLSTALHTITERQSFAENQDAIKRLGVGLSALVSAGQSIVNTSWLRDENVWTVARSALSAIDTAKLALDSLSKLAKLEYETSRLNSPALQQVTSAAAQIASIQRAFLPNPQLARLLEDFAGYASNQHRAIQKSIDDQAEVEWHLGAIDAASRFVDRQVKWSKAIIQEFPENPYSDNARQTDTDALPSPVSQIGYHIGYSKRKNVDITPEEALEHSTLVEITEKGKNISENIITLNELMKDHGKEDVFKYTDKVAKGIITMSTLVCTSDTQLGVLIDALYFIFYENLERIKSLVGGGNKQTGDQMVRENDLYQCVFNVKTIRSDLRHDLDHGEVKKVRKRFADIGDCYKHYCKQRPLRPKDFKILQLRLYDEFLALEKDLIEKLRSFYSES